MYFITTVYPSDRFPGDVGSRCVGYLKNLDEAIKAVEENSCDIYEAGAYPYAVIEHIEEGIYQYDENPIWFKYNKDTDKYEKLLEKPSCIENYLIGFAIG